MMHRGNRKTWRTSPDSSVAQGPPQSARDTGNMCIATMHGRKQLVFRSSNQRA